MNHSNDFERALEALAKRIQKKKAPTRHEARDLLIALGERLQTDPAAGDEAVRALREITAPVHELWKAACAEELVMASSEHVRSVDPRFLDHPRYDFEYTFEARELLEARLQAAKSLDLPLEEFLMKRVREADERLRPYRKRHAAPDDPQAG